MADTCSGDTNKRRKGSGKNTVRERRPKVKDAQELVSAKEINYLSDFPTSDMYGWATLKKTWDILGGGGLLFAYSYLIPYLENSDFAGLWLKQKFLGQPGLRISRDSPIF